MREEFPGCVWDYKIINCWWYALDIRIGFNFSKFLNLTNLNNKLDHFPFKSKQTEIHYRNGAHLKRAIESGNDCGSIRKYLTRCNFSNGHQLDLSSKERVCSQLKIWKITLIECLFNVSYKSAADETISSLQRVESALQSSFSNFTWKKISPTIYARHTKANDAIDKRAINQTDQCDKWRRERLTE